MTSVVAPGLDELAGRESPAWLWDTERGRISWANQAGAAWFGAEGGFDLAEIIFDPADPAIALLRDIAARLQRGTSETVPVSFLAAVSKQPVACTCYVHNLADGRPGLLVSGDIGQTTAGTLPPDLQELALTAFPLPVCVLLGARSVLFTNQALQDAFAGRTDFDFAGGFIAQAHTNGTASGMCRLGDEPHRRDIRVIVRRLKRAERLADTTFLLILEDVSERKALERSLLSMAKTGLTGADLLALTDKPENHQKVEVAKETGNAPPRQANRPRDVAATLSHLKKTIERQSGQPSAQAGAGSDTEKVPNIVRSTLNSLPQPLVLIDHDGEMLFANDVAVDLLEASNWRELAERTTLADAIAALEGEDGEISLFTLNDEPVSFDVLLTSFPWQDGPVLQATLSPAHDGEQADNRRAPGSKKKLKKRGR